MILGAARIRPPTSILLISCSGILLFDHSYHLAFGVGSRTTKVTVLLSFLTVYFGSNCSSHTYLHWQAQQKRQHMNDPELIWETKQKKEKKKREKKRKALSPPRLELKLSLLATLLQRPNPIPSLLISIFAWPFVHYSLDFFVGFSVRSHCLSLLLSASYVLLFPISFYSSFLTLTMSLPSCILVILSNRYFSSFFPTFQPSRDLHKIRFIFTHSSSFKVLDLRTCCPCNDPPERWQRSSDWPGSLIEVFDANRKTRVLECPQNYTR